MLTLSDYAISRFPLRFKRFGSMCMTRKNTFKGNLLKRNTVITNLLKKDAFKGYILLLPVIVLVTLFMFYPFLKGIWLSFFGTKYGFGEMDFVGLKNYINIVNNEFFFLALKNSLIWVVFSMILNIVVPTSIAVLMDRPYRGKQVSIAAVLIPWLTPVVGLAMMSRWLLEPEVGVINSMLRNLGIVRQGINFLGSTELAFPVMIFLNFFQFCPFGILLTSAALSTISQEHYEAMSIDGAGGWKIFTNLIMPSIGRMLGFLLFFGIVWTFNSYGLIYILTGGGPSHATYTIPVMIYEKAYKSINVGQSTALATMTGVVLITLGFFYFRSVYKNTD
jgi:multiple sugar transport system permease protein